MNIFNQIEKAAQGENIIIGFNVFGYEDALELVRAAEEAEQSILLMINRDASGVMAIEHWGALLSSIAGASSIPIGVHLDHCSDKDLIFKAMDSGFTSVMYDGSKLPLEDNIKNTREIVQRANEKGIKVEGEVGCVPYSDKGETEIQLTLPEEAKRLQEESGLHMLAVSVGNVHRLTDKKVNINFSLLKEIEALCNVPLVIHGASGIEPEDLQRLKKTKVGKINLGTAIRQEFGQGLREEILSNPEEFDRLKLMVNPRERIYKKALELINLLK